MLTCPKCQTSNVASAKFCESCGKSFASVHEADDMIEHALLQEARKGMWALGVVALVQVLFVLILDPGSGILWGIAGLFAVLAVWALRAPLLASSIGLGIYMLLHVMDALVDPMALTRGIILKIVVISLLVSAIRGGFKHREFRLQRGVS